MRLLTGGKSTADKSSKRSQESAKDVSGKPDKAGKSEAKSTAKAKDESAPAPVTAMAVDYTRPESRTELLVDLQRRVIHLETLATRRLTAAEYAIAVEAMTGQSVDAWKRQGYVVESCSCTNLACKGWRMTPLDHFRTAAQSPEKDSTPVRVDELKDVAAEQASTDLDAVFKQMFKDGLLKKGKNDTTLIPKDGPMSWSHTQQLAFAKGFDMEELLDFEGKPRELQRRLIAQLREVGYDILSAPEKS